MNNCDFCVRGEWYCKNKCPERPVHYSKRVANEKTKEGT